AEFRAREGNCFRIEIADAIVLWQTTLRRKPHAGADRNAIENCGDRTRTAEVARDDAKWGGLIFEWRPGGIEMADGFHNLIASAKFCAALGNEFMTCAMEPITANAEVAP